jgi:hypothetical protein
VPRPCTAATEMEGATGGDAGAASEGLPPAPARALAFGTHLLLVLEALGVLYAAPHGNEGLLVTTRCDVCGVMCDVLVTTRCDVCGVMCDV